MKRAMVTAAYGAPTILAVTNVQEVVAMSPTPSNPTVTITAVPADIPTYTLYTLVGNGFLPNTAYVFIVFTPNNEMEVFRGVLTNASGSFTNQLREQGNIVRVGTFPAGVNGGVAFVVGAVT